MNATQASKAVFAGFIGLGGITLGAGASTLDFQQHLLASDGTAAQEFSISVAADGDVLFVGAHHDATNGVNAGAAYVFRRQGDSWVEEQKLLPDSIEAYDRFGFSLDVQNDVAVIGTAWDDDRANNAGAVYVFRHHASSGWTQEAKLMATDGGVDDQLGFSVSFSGNAILAGAPNSGSNVGAAYVFRHNGAGWVQEAKLTPADGAANDYFAASVSLSGNVALMGKYGDDTNGGSAGSAYIFRHTGSTWIQEQKLMPDDGAANDLFGASVSASGSSVVVGARHDDDSGTNAGAAYVFRFAGSSWYQEQKLMAADGEGWDKFGRAVAVSGNTIAVGAYWDDNGYIPDCGSVYVYRYSGGTWTETDLLRDEMGWFDDYFGSSVAVAGDTVICGATNDDNNGNNSGSVFVFAGESGGNGSGDPDCNGNGNPDGDDIASGASTDCNGNGIPDECEELADCDADGTPDVCESDCNADGTPDDCETDCNGDGFPDECQNLGDCDNDGTPDDCESDCDSDGTPDDCEADCNGNGTPDDCESFDDCNGNGTPDSCDIASGGSADVNGNGQPDECETDCNGNGVPDDADVANGTSGDCNNNGMPDECDIAAGASADGNGDGVPDECQITDCNDNGTPDTQDIASGASEDCNGNGVPDECEAGGGSFQVSSGPMSPIGAGSPQAFAFDNPGFVSNDVLLTVRARADLSSSTEWVEIVVNGVSVGVAFQTGASDCTSPADEAQILVPAQTFNDAAGGESSQVVITMIASSNVNAGLCSSQNFIEVDVQTSTDNPLDADGNGVLDTCETPCAEDVDGDGWVGVGDLVVAVLSWGVCDGPCPADLDGDNIVGVSDLIMLLDAWGPCD